MTTSKQRRWLLIKALESGASLKEALEISKEADDFLNLKGDEQWKDHAPVAPISQANGSTMRGGLNSVVPVTTATIKR